MERYSVITEKNPREIVLLKGTGCRWKKCAFCDYHLDSSSDEKANYELNRQVLSNVTGKYSRLEVINSGSFAELDRSTISLILDIAAEKEIRNIHFEAHWMYRGILKQFSETFASHGINVIFKIGVETFDIPYREAYLNKGMGNATPQEIANAGFKEINLLCGAEGQSSAQADADIRTGLEYFDRVCVNVMTKNSSKVSPSSETISEFVKNVYPKYADDPRVDILLNNTDFGVG